MVKILFFIETLSYNGSIGGAEKVLLTLVNHMDTSEFDITVQTVFPDEYAYLLNQNIRYRSCYPKKNAASASLYRMESELGLTYPLHIRDDYDIEVAFLEYATTKVLAASTNKKARKAAWIHCDFDTAIDNKEAFVAKTRKQYQQYDKIVCVSEQCKKSFDELFASGFNSVVLHNVIDDREILSKAKEALPEGVSKTKYTLCSVGRFSRQKNHLRLLKACKRLHDEGFPFELWLVGDGILRPEVESFISENNMGGYVRLWGFQANPYPFIEKADLLVCSSFFEGFSTVITEGVLLRKQILTTDCSGMHEILDGYSGGMIVPNDDEAFYSGLRSCAEHPLDSEQTGGLAFSTEALVKENEAFFKRLLSDGERQVHDKGN